VRAAILSELGGTPAPADVDEPEAGDRELVDVLAVALNPLDLAVAAGRHYIGHPPLPYIPGSEAVGRRSDGSRVYLFGDTLGLARDGALAGHATIAASHLVPVDDGVDDATAVALGIGGIVAWSAIDHARVGPGDRVLVRGASGFSGLVAVQAAKIRGAERVVAAGRDLGRLEWAKEVGADEAVTLDGDLKGASGGDGPTVVIDPLWGEPVAAAAVAAAPRARIVNYGQSAGPEATFTSGTVRGKELEIVGHSNFARTPAELHEIHAELLRHAASGRLRVGFETFGLEEVEDAWRRQQAGAKSVVVISQS